MTLSSVHTRLQVVVFAVVLAAATPPSSANRVSEAYGQLQLHFEANRGQTHEDVRFLARGPGYTFYLTAGEAVLVLARPNPDAKRDSRSAPERLSKQPQGTPAVLRMSLVGAASKPLVQGLEELPGKANYFIDNDPSKWRTNVPTYAKVHYRSVYPGIDLIYYGNQRQLEYDFVVAPGADPKTIVLGFQGADKLEIDAQGDLVVHAAGGSVRQKKPFIYQEIDGIRREIEGAYILKSANQVGFKVAAYDRGQPLIIDPMLLYSTYLGGTGVDAGRAIAVDTSGNAYVTGETLSLDFPTTLGAFQPDNAGSSDAFVTKLNPTGSGVVYSTYLGGSADDQGLGIAVDNLLIPNAYVTGRTNSPNFPTTPGAFDTTHNEGDDAFVTKLDATGSALVYSTYLGGRAEDKGNGIAVDGASNAYVIGTTISTDFPTTAGAFDTMLDGGDAFVTKLNAAGSALIYSTFLGGGGNDFGNAIALDPSGDAYLTGQTASPDFPTTAGAVDTTFNDGGFDAFVTRLHASGSALVYSTFLGGSNVDFGLGIALDSSANAYVTGQTGSADFPTTPGAFQTAFGGGTEDAFVTKLNPAGSAPLVYSSYLGGSSNDAGTGIAVDAALNAYVTGLTISPDFPTFNAIQATLAGAFDAFVTKVNPPGTGLVWSTYLGGNSNDFGNGIALDIFPSPNAYVTGLTGSANFPTTPGAFDTTLGGPVDAFVAKIGDVVLPPPPTVGKVTGGGSIDVVNGIGTFGFIVQRQAADASIHGQLQYVNHASGDKVHSVEFTSFAIIGNTATFGGVCTNNVAPCTFTVNVTDNDEPGFEDTFTISVSAGPTEGGTLRSGNIQIHD
jgi:hypothetical protein